MSGAVGRRGRLAYYAAVTRWGEPFYSDTVTALMTKLINRVHIVTAHPGHADPVVTSRVYSHVLREQAAGVGDIFAQAVNSSH